MIISQKEEAAEKAWKPLPDGRGSESVLSGYGSMPSRPLMWFEDRSA